MIYQDDTITLYKLGTETVSDTGIFEPNFTSNGTVVGDAQPYSPKAVFQDYGIDTKNAKRVFTPVNTKWEKGLQCAISGVFYWILDIKDWDNHYEVIVYEVI